MTTKYYTYNLLNEFIGTIRKFKNIENGVWLYRYCLFFSLREYLRYTEAQVNIQKENIKLYYQNNKPKNYVEQNTLDVICSSTIATYGLFICCNKFISKLTNKNYKNLTEYKNWLAEVAEKRDRFSAHPDARHKEKIIAYGITSFSGSGEIRLRLVHTNNETQPKFYTFNKWGEELNFEHAIVLNPGKDFKTLKKFIEKVIQELKKRWQLG